MKKSLYRKAFTLIELTMVIGILMGMTAMSVFGLTYFTSLSRANRAEAILRQVEKARLSYLIDHPTHSYRQITTLAISPYLPGGFSAAIQVMEMNGYTLTESDLRTPTIHYSVIEGGRQFELGPNWNIPIRGFCCTNCPDGSGCD